MRTAVFLRSINVGGRRVTNDALIGALEALGLTDVAAYQAAGNLVFRGTLGADALRAGLSAQLGYDVPVILRTLPELTAIARTDPFSAAEHGASTGKVQVFLLERAPDDATAAGILDLETDADRLRLDGPQLFWLPAGRMTDSALDLRRLGSLLGLNTCRTVGTLQRMAKKWAEP